MSATLAYNDFLATKGIEAEPVGIEAGELLSELFDFQAALVEWALQRGRAALFCDCGLGKTPMQLEWARQVSEHVGKPVLILAPLAVSSQTHREGEKFGIEVTVCREAEDVAAGVNVTNYERLDRFDPHDFGGIVLDESSILKSYDGSTRRALTVFAFELPFRLCCTATPAPNDLVELTNHSEFLGIMSAQEIKALFFTQDGNTSSKFRLKRHGQRDFWRWMASWSAAVRKPSDLGYDDERFVLPELLIEHKEVESDPADAGQLFAVEAQTMAERRMARRESTDRRVGICADLVNASDQPWVVWCDLNAESESLVKAIPDAVEVRGSDSSEHKEQALIGFSEGKHRVLVTKPTIAGFGMNWQHCANVAFVGLSDSYEQFYQAIRRCWRFGQERDVHCYVVTAEAEGAVVANIRRKEKQAAEMMDGIVRHMRSLALGKAQRDVQAHETESEVGDDWTMMLGDCVERIADVEDESVGLTVFSPPFPGMYAYTNSPRDMGNVANMPEMIEQFEYLIPELLRVTMLSRTCAIHLTQGVATKTNDDYIGIKDFRGEVIRAMEAGGWIYYGEVCIEKDPQVKAIRTKDRGLLFKSLAKDSANMHMALADYMLQFRKPGENPAPIAAGISERYDNEDGWITPEEWIEWASPVWYRQRKGVTGGIRETNVLNVAQARETNDERHLCPLQLDVIERAVKLWSAPGELVLSPFVGIGSEGVVALKLGRRFVGIELKRSYYEHACRHLAHAKTQLALEIA